MTSELLELDGYSEKLKIAFEYQGEHHEKLHHFNNFNEGKLFEQQERDRYKVRICTERGITLIVIPSKYICIYMEFDMYLHGIKFLFQLNKICV
jgi:hypothetical protein